MTVGVVLQVLLALPSIRLLRASCSGPARRSSCRSSSVPVPPITPASVPVVGGRAEPAAPADSRWSPRCWCQVRYLRTGRIRSGVLGRRGHPRRAAVLREDAVHRAAGRRVHALLVRAAAVPWRRVRHLLARTGGSGWPTWSSACRTPATTSSRCRRPDRRAAAAATSLGELAGSSFGHAVIPGLLGGPWTWRPVGFAGALADPGTSIGTWRWSGSAAIAVGSIALGGSGVRLAAGVRLRRAGHSASSRSAARPSSGR